MKRQSFKIEKLKNDKDSEAIKSGQSFFIEPSKFEQELAVGNTMYYTTKLLQENPNKVFPLVMDKKLRKPPFYFRSLEKEFKPS